MESAFRDIALSPDFRVIETLRWDGARAVRATRHLDRVAASCAALGIPFDRAGARAQLDSVKSRTPRRLRLTIAPDGACALSHAPLAPVSPPWRVTLATQRLDPADPWLRHKTTRRGLYDTARALMPEGIDEVIFANTQGEICEGAITNIFFDLGAGLCTPPLRCGLLPGVLRAELLDSGTCREETLPLERLEEARLWVGNSLRGLIPARFVGTTTSSEPR